MSATVLVTNGAAPIGRYIVDALADEGHQAMSVGRRFDLPSLLHVIDEHSVAGIVHGTDDADLQLSIEMPVATVLATVEGVLHLLEAARLARLDGRIVLLSSTSVYGSNPGPLDESTPLRPRSPQAVATVAGEQLAGVYSELYGLDVVILRLGDVYGPELNPPAIVGSILSAAVSGESFHTTFGADHTFHLTHGDDVTRAVVAALNAASPTRRVYNITGGERHSVREIADLLSDRFPQSGIELGPGAVPGLDRQGSLEIGAADLELGYRPLWGLARGLDDYAEWLLAKREAA